MATEIETALREAGRQRRKVRVTGRYRGEAGDQYYEREWEPYEVDSESALVFSCYRDEFRRVKLEEIVKIEITDSTFTPRRPIDL